MNKVLIVFLLLLLSSGILHTQIINKEPLSPRITQYAIDARLDTKSKKVIASMDAYWINISDKAVPDLQLHMYMNAFKSEKTTMYSESGSSPVLKPTDKGWIDISSFTDKKGNDLMPFMEFISTDDGNPYDSTVLKINLPDPVPPGDTMFIKVEFETKLPGRIRRTGYTDDFYFVAQWFPKFGVYEPAGMRYSTTGGWNCHQFHAHSEFYANHSVYDVKITVPENYVVGSGGLLISETTDSTSGNTKSLTYRAEDIVDFAWTAWPGYAVFNDKWEHVNITLLLPAERKNQFERQFRAVKNALEYLTKNVGPFPWPHLTFVDPPLKGAGAGGMEYTTLFTTISLNIMPEFLHFPEMVTVHEFGHAYFMGILASNEFEEPWLDEGINSYWEQRIIDHYYGENSGLIDHPLLRIADKTYSRLGYVRSGSRQATTNDQFSWNYPHGTYSMMSYLKSSVWMSTLTGIVGAETVNEIFREYFRKWAFKHPSGTDFIHIVNEVVTKNYGDEFGPDMNWFFNQVLYGTGICDYKVSGISNSKINGLATEKVIPDSLNTEKSEIKPVYKAVVQLERIGELTFPVDVLIHFNDGSEISEKWDGKERYKDFTYPMSDKIDWVKIDPEYKIRMDVNFINNSMTLDPDPVPVRRIANRMMLFMELFLSFITL